VAILVSSSTINAGTTDTASVTLSDLGTNGNTLVLVVSWNRDVVIDSIDDNGASLNTYELITSGNAEVDGTVYNVALYYVPSMYAAATLDFEATVTMSGTAAELTMCLMEWGGYLPAFPLLDPASVNYISSSMVNPAITSWVQSPSIGQLIITGVKTSGSLSVNSGWTQVQQNETAAIGVYYQITGTNTPSGSITLKPTDVGSGATSLCVAAVFGCPSLGGTIAGKATVSGTPTVRHSVSGTIAGKASITQGFHVNRGLIGTIEGASSVSGRLSEEYGLVGHVQGAASLSGHLYAAYSIAGTIRAKSALFGNMFVPLAPSTALTYKGFTVAPQITIYVNGQALTFNSPSVTMLNPVPGSVQQAVQRTFNVLLVPLHSQILAWDYGTDTSWLDRPYNVRGQKGIYAAIQAIQTWVPNVTVRNCTVTPVNNGAFNQYVLAVELDFNPPNQSNQAVYGAPGGTLVTTVGVVGGVPTVVQETLTI
jgi:hypothetical protein